MTKRQGKGRKGKPMQKPKDFNRFQQAATLTVLSCLLLTGCQTMKIPSGPDIAKLEPLTNAPTFVAAVQDSREKAKIGNICLTSISAKKDQVIACAQNYLEKFLYDQGIDSEFVQGLNVADPEKIRQSIQQTGASGAIYLDVYTITVKSIDILMDPPKYGLFGEVVICGRDGQPVYRTEVQSNTISQSLTEKGKGEALAQLIQNAVESLGQNARFKKELAVLNASQG